MKQSFTWLVAAVLVSVSSAQYTGVSTLDPTLIEEVFGLQDITVRPTTGTSVFTDDDGASCSCVPYYLCDPTTNTTYTDGKFDGAFLIDIRFKPESCQESVEVCCKYPRAPENPIPPPVVMEPTKPVGCGIRNEKGIDFQITGSVGNQESQFGEFPWTVAILNAADNGAICAGSLIHPNVILTGAHCIKKYSANQLKIRAGEWDTQTTKERLPFQERIASSHIIHPSFNPKTLANDVGLIFLSAPFDPALHINTICLPEQNKNFDNKKKCIATGWGKTVFGKAGRYAVIMKKVELDVVDYNTCNKAFKSSRLGPRFVLHDTFLCAGGMAGKDTCEGDGGAPLVCPSSTKRYHQAGIVAWGIGCNNNLPAAYTYVSKFRSWIDQNVRQGGFDPSSYTATA